MVRKYDSAWAAHAARVQLCAGLARRACGWEDEAMGRLDDVDLSLKLSRKEQDRLLALHGTRLAQLRLTLAGLIGTGRARAAAVRALRGLGRRRQGRRHQAPGRAARRPPRPRQVVRRADARREAPPLPAPLRPRAAGLGRHGRARSHVVRARARRARRGLRHRGAVAARLPRDRRLRAHARRRRHDHRQALPAHLRGRAAQALRAPPPGSAEGVEAHRRGLAQPREAPGLRGRARGDVRAHRHRARAVADRPGRVQALRARARDAEVIAAIEEGCARTRLPAAGAARSR